MKYNKVLYILALAMSLPLLVMVSSPIPAYADYGSISPHPSQAEIGDRIAIRGHGFHRRAAVHIYFSSDYARLDDQINHEVTAYERVALGTTDSEGKFEASFTVPDKLTAGSKLEDVHGGTYYLYATHSRSEEIVAVADFVVTAVELDTRDGMPGTQVEIRGAGFDDKEDIVLRYDGAQIYPVNGKVTTNKYGAFICTITIPQSVNGLHLITAEDESRNEAKIEFTVRSGITVVPPLGTPNTEVTVIGTGFISWSSVTIYFGNYEMARDGTNEHGSFETTFVVPLAPNIYEVRAVDNDSNTGTAGFSVVPSMSLSQTTGNVGTEVTVIGTDFLADSIITINYDTLEVAKVNANSDGAFSATFTIPVSQHGNHTVTASDGTSTATSTFTMESRPPPTPAPLLPENMGEAKPLAYFDWEDVTDPSGLTYTQQIARDANFLLMVLVKEGLIDSECTLTEEEELQATPKEAPYYWRVRGVDGASNEGDWSPPRSFYVGLSRPGVAPWVLYTWIGLGVLLIGFFALWLGRKIAKNVRQST